MSFFRSESMTLCQIILHNESAFNCLIELGYVGKLQFRHIFNGNAVANNLFLPQIERCNELKRIMNHLQNEIDDFNITTVIYPDVDKDEIPQANDLQTIESTLQQIYEELTDLERNNEGLKRKQIHLHEHLEVIRAAEGFLTGNQGTDAIITLTDGVIVQLITNERGMAVSNDTEHLSYITGTIPIDRYYTFESILWRITRGNFFIKSFDLLPTQDSGPSSIHEIRRKYIFMIFFKGPTIKQQILKICQGFEVYIYDCPETIRKRKFSSIIMTQELQDLHTILQQTQLQRIRILSIASANLYMWQVKLNKILMVYYILNHMNRVSYLNMAKYLQAECWIPTKDLPLIRSALLRGAQRTGRSDTMFIPMLNIIHKRRDLAEIDKPTYFVTNRFTKGFQNLIDAYGIAEYQELNPAPYTIITFPFLFAVMFGDIGHGVIMLIFGLWMLLKEKSLELKTRCATKQNEIWEILFTGRYIITLMGAFSIYTGLIYNDCFSKSLNIYGSSWRVNLNNSISLKSPQIQLDPTKSEHYVGTPYILGMDPIWDVSGESAITTFNSLKMKLAIILGVAQMIFGLVLSAFNYLHKREFKDLLLVFVPQLVFFLCLFLYLVFLIFYKWINFGGHNAAPYNSSCAPSLLIIFINMLLMKDAVDPPSGCDLWMFELQDIVQTLLLGSALICIPILFAGKPIYFMIQDRKNRKTKNEDLRMSRHRSTMSNVRKSLIYNVESSMYAIKFKTTHKNLDETDLGELWIHSGIHCIESILGSVSHTASYLRLWALSLAHDQLSTVLWNMILKIGLTGKRGYWNAVILYVMFILWSILTVTILVVMEGLSAFLHTLRLHWVEFQSKFYKGDGVVFTPFHFKTSTANKRDFI